MENKANHIGPIISSEEMSVYVIGSSHFLGSLMSYFITKTIGVNCVVVERIDEIPRSDNRKKSLVLLDCLGNSKERCLRDCELEWGKLIPDSLFAIFNLSPDINIEREAIWYGVDGFFYEQDSWDVFEKGVRSVFSGETWIPRRVLIDYVKRNRKADHTREKRVKKFNLTPKEMEVLKIAASGAQNSEIAEELFVSPHTVKTHLSNIYKKIDVKNRFQAIIWTAENL